MISRVGVKCKIWSPAPDWTVSPLVSALWPRDHDPSHTQGENRPADGIWSTFRLSAERRLQTRGQQGNYLNVNAIEIMKSIIVNNTQMSVNESTFNFINETTF